MSPTRQQLDDWRRAFASSAEPWRNGEDCPSPERLWESAEGKLSGRDAEEMILHLGECGNCAAAWRLARELAPPVTVRDERGGVAWLAGWRWLAATTALASLTVVAGLGILQWPDWPGRGASYRAPRSEWLQPGPRTAETISRDDAVLSWAAGPPGTTYDLRVTTEALDVVYSIRHLEGPVAALPASAVESIPENGRILWQVTAHLPDGTEVDSKTFITRLD
jgi:hypothetical protein